MIILYLTIKIKIYVLYFVREHSRTLMFQNRVPDLLRLLSFYGANFLKLCFMDNLSQNHIGCL